MCKLKNRIANVIKLEKLEELSPALEPLSLEKLTKIELAVAYGIFRGASVENIAKARCTSPHTIRNHLKAVYRKLKVDNARTLAIRYWYFESAAQQVPSPSEQALLPFLETA